MSGQVNNLCCCSPSSWIRFTAWSQITVFTTTFVLCTVILLFDLLNKTTGDTRNVLWTSTSVLLLIVTLLLPILPTFLMLLGFEFLSNARWPKRFLRDQGFLIAVWIELTVITVFILMAVILLVGFKKKKRKYLNAWMRFGILTVVILILETVLPSIFIVSQIWVNAAPVTSVVSLQIPLLLRSSISVVLFLFPVKAVHSYMEEISLELRALGGKNNPKEVTQLIANNC